MTSIIIPTYNQPDRLLKCLASIAAQGVNDYEIIVVNDRSTVSLGEAYRLGNDLFGGKIRFLNNQKNHGAPYSRNKGARHARGEFLLFCDDDVVMEPDMLESMTGALRLAPNASFAYSNHKFGWKTFRFWPFDKKRLEMLPYVHSTSLLRRNDFPGWDEKLKRLQDWDLFLTMCERGKTGVWIDRTLFRIKPGGTMSAWRPSFAYRWLPFLPSVKKYQAAVKVIKDKHNLK